MWCTATINSPHIASAATTKWMWVNTVHMMFDHVITNDRVRHSTNLLRLQRTEEKIWRKWIYEKLLNFNEKCCWSECRERKKLCVVLSINRRKRETNCAEIRMNARFIRTKRKSFAISRALTFENCICPLCSSTVDQIQSGNQNKHFTETPKTSTLIDCSETERQQSLIEFRFIKTANFKMTK